MTARPVALRGRREVTVTVVVPRLLNWLVTERLTPSPRLISATTAPTPMTMPRAVRAARSRLMPMLTSAIGLMK